MILWWRLIRTANSDVKIWIRHLDGTVEDLGRANETEALSLFDAQDWSLELRDYDPDRDGPDHCLPAFGIVDGEDASCDISPFDEESCKVNLYFHRPSRLFGIFPMKKNVWEHLPNHALSAVAEVVRLFYARDIDGLCQMIEESKRRSAATEPE